METVKPSETKKRLPTPDAPKDAKLAHEEIVEGMRALRQRVKPSKMNTREMVNEGRRYSNL
jgi:hypothetical protein